MSDYPKYTTLFSRRNKAYRLLWRFTRAVFFAPFKSRLFNRWRVFLLRLFGAKVANNTIVYSSADIWMPKNLTIGTRSCIGPHTIIYNPSEVVIGNKVTISQYSYLCAGSHDISTLSLDFISAPIIINDYAWICASCFIMMGVNIAEGSVIGATSSVFKNTEPWSVYGGSPAVYLKKRVIKDV